MFSGMLEALLRKMCGEYAYANSFVNILYLSMQIIIILIKSSNVVITFYTDI